jgi:predicted metalloprotease with PDZ domain
MTRGDDGASIYVAVAAGADRRVLDDDWVLTHEMIHAVSPSLPTAQHWLEEGLATYVEPIARARAGRLTESAVWLAIASDYAQGLPAADDRGLDRTPTWGRTYYGGAIFCLEADVAIRARTGNAKSLQDALRAIAATGANVTETWSIERWLAAADAATGTTALSELYAQMKESPEPRELDSLWRRLGVRIENGAVQFDESAPLAAVRRALVAGSGS